MERLTYRGENGKGYVRNDGYYNHVSLYLARVAERLAAYEDTGYEPVEINSLEAEWNACRLALDSYRSIGTVEEFRTALRRIAEDDKAREDGRLVELPCKVGDTAFYIGFGRVDEEKVIAFDISETGYRAITEIDYEDRFGFDENEFGKTVFLTRQEAEAALSARRKHND